MRQVVLFGSKSRLHHGPATTAWATAPSSHQGMWDEGREASVKTLIQRACTADLWKAAPRVKIKEWGPSWQMGNNFPQDFWVEHSCTQRRKCDAINQAGDDLCPTQSEKGWGYQLSHKYVIIALQKWKNKDSVHTALYYILELLPNYP